MKPQFLHLRDLVGCDSLRAPRTESTHCTLPTCCLPPIASSSMPCASRRHKSTSTFDVSCRWQRARLVNRPHAASTAATSGVLRDLPWAGTPMVLKVSTRRFFCDQPDCPRRIFAEALPDLARRHARATPRPRRDAGRHRHGVRRRAGTATVRPARHQQPAATRSCGGLRGAPSRPADAQAGAVIGVDDFAFRRGQTYGNDRRRPPVRRRDRPAARPDPASRWKLGWRHEPLLPVVVTRDRSGVYAKAITTAAPEGRSGRPTAGNLLANCREVLRTGA